MPREKEERPRTVIVPASSVRSERRSDRERERGEPRYQSSARSERSYRSANYNTYSRNLHSESEYEQNSDAGSTNSQDRRPGRTRFPKKLVDREACEELCYPFSVSDSGAITVLQALNREEIEELVELTKKLRRGSNPGKAVSFYEKALVHEVPPFVPSPPPSDICSISEYSEVPPSVRHHQSVVHVRPPPPPQPAPPVAVDEVVHTRSGPIAIPIDPTAGAMTHYEHAPIISSSPRYEALLPPAPSAPVPGTVKTIEIDAPSLSLLGGKTPEEKVKKDRQKAMKADAIAARKEDIAAITGDYRDEQEAWKARARANELIRRAEEREAEERRKYEEKKLKRRNRPSVAIKVARNAKGEILILEK